MGKSLTFPTTSRGPSLNTGEFCSGRVTIMKNFFKILWKRLCLKFYQQRRMKWLCIPDGSRLFGIVGVDFFSTSDLPNPNMSLRLRLIRARPNFNKVSDDPNISLETVKFSLYIRHIAVKDH